MGFTSPFGNLIYFVSAKPPLVVFTLCLASFALTTYSLAYYIQRSEKVLNPDFPLDWNTLISRMAELNLCLNDGEENESDLLRTLASTSLHVASPIFGGLGNGSLSPVSSEQESQGNMSIVTLSVTMALSWKEGLAATYSNLSTIWGILRPHHLKLDFPDAPKDAALNIVFHFHGGNMSALQQPQDLCLILEGPQQLLPSTKSPRECSQDFISSIHKHTEVNKHSVAKFVLPDHHDQNGDSVEVPDMQMDGLCAEGSVLHLAYYPDPDLPVYITMRDRSLINLHLLHTSYFLFVLVMTMVCYALVKGRPSQKSGTDDPVPSIGSL